MITGITQAVTYPHASIGGGDRSVPNRRQVLKAGVFTGAAVLVPVSWKVLTASADPLPGGTLDPTTVPKYVTPLFVLPAMPRAANVSGGIDNYEIAARQISQQ